MYTCTGIVQESYKLKCVHEVLVDRLVKLVQEKCGSVKLTAMVMSTSSLHDNGQP